MANGSCSACPESPPEVVLVAVGFSFPVFEFTVSEPPPLEQALTTIIVEAIRSARCCREALNHPFNVNPSFPILINLSKDKRRLCFVALLLQAFVIL
jgi:hypothetical protein